MINLCNKKFCSLNPVRISIYVHTIDYCTKIETKVSSKILLVKSSKNNFIFQPAFYLIMCLMKASKNFEKIADMEI